MPMTSGGPMPVRQWIDVILPLLLTGLLIALCFQLLLPFVGLLLWTIILAICLNPLQGKLVSRGWRPGRAALLIGGVLVAVVLIPTAIAAIAAASSIPDLVAGIQSGNMHLRPPPPGLASIPLVGAKLDAAWARASNDLPAFLVAHKLQLQSMSRWLLKQAAGSILAVLLIVAAIVLAAVALAYAKVLTIFCRTLLARITGDDAHGWHLLNVIGATVRSVVTGVIAVAFVQALLLGIGFFVAGVPGAGLLSLVAMFLGVVQVPVAIVALPAIVWGFSALDTVPAIIFTVWSIIAGLSDAALKPLLIGHGLEVPMPVILLGVIGGVMAYGLVGLFIGAVLLAVGYVLFGEWLDETDVKESPAAADRKSA
jgi:predicted PurR-regulated permease PerM